MEAMAVVEEVFLNVGAFGFNGELFAAVGRCEELSGDGLGAVQCELADAVGRCEEQAGVSAEQVAEGVVLQEGLVGAHFSGEHFGLEEVVVHVAESV